MRDAKSSHTADYSTIFSLLDYLIPHLSRRLDVKKPAKLAGFLVFKRSR
ncbi:hypothetical protein MTsN2n6_15740 [Vibrio fortis]